MHALGKAHSLIYQLVLETNTGIPTTFCPFKYCRGLPARGYHYQKRETAQKII